ncbi:FHA domain-containing protein [Bordetella sp. N]|uniref:FHA domain-containing protein n=1 Tax=Bordetella sp. N TaxID=1746199 RepID=UPI00070DCBCB|nr:FHA domain-containing protein [Bordetella sp. N]ALM85926.1 hypothetical protein ASB57_25925 [Bordetella sp. N]
MKLTAIRRIDESTFAAAQADFAAPGGTIGRGRENRLVLEDQPGGLCRVQAMVRVSDTASWLVNLSSMANVSINGDPLAPEQETALRHGDEVAIGLYVLLAEDPMADAVVSGAALATPVAAMPGAIIAPAQALAAEAEPAPAVDIFSDLMGPGTLPVGSAPDLSAHPFDMTSAAGRNPEDPLSQLDPRHTGFDGPSRDPLSMFPNPDDRHVDHVFTDARPSTLHGEDPLARLNDDPIASTLGRQGQGGTNTTDRDNVREQAGHMRPPTVRQGKVENP